MRFSLRWLFVASTYAALVAAAIVTGKSWLADVVWGVVIFAIGYAIIVSIISTSRRRAIAVGFVVFTTANLIAWMFYPNRTPVMTGFRAAGYSISGEGEVNEHDPMRGFVRNTFPQNSIRVVNGVGVLAAGCVGCLLGRLAYARGESCQTQDHDN
jgi:hypothetical protein